MRDRTGGRAARTVILYKLATVVAVPQGGEDGFVGPRIMGPDEFFQVLCGLFAVIYVAGMLSRVKER